MGRETTLKIHGMSCGNCERHVVKALQGVPGVAQATANAAAGSATVQLSGAVAKGALAAALADAGYPLIGGGDDAEAADPEAEPARSVAQPQGPPALGAQTTRLQIGGMTCAACVASVEKALLNVPGVAAASVSLVLESAQVQAGPEVSAPQLVAAVTAAGYRAQPADAAPVQHAPANWRELLPVVWCLLAGVATMAGSAPLMEHGDHADPMMRAYMAMDAATRWALPQLWHIDPFLLRWALLALATSVVLGPARAIFAAALAGARRRSTDMNTLVAIALGAAWAMSAVATIWPTALAGQGVPAQLWYDAVPWVPGFVLLGRLLEGRARATTRAGIDALLALQPQTALVLRDGQRTRVAATDLVSGDRVLVAAGERVPCDGTVEEGSGLFDEALMTGEALPQKRALGDRVLGGTLAAEGSVVITATHTGAESALARIVAETAQALLAKPKIQRMADRAAAAFTPFVLASAALAGIGWLALGPPGNWTTALVVSVSVVIVACPCAMGLAVPMAVAVATGVASARGLLIRTGAALERAGRITDVVFDKTGTLTTGKPTVAEMVWWGDRPAVGWATVRALLERSAHPLAHAVAAEVAKRYPQENVPAIADVAVVQGHGVQAVVRGVVWRVGNYDWVAQAAAPELQEGGKDESIQALHAASGALVFACAGQFWVGAVRLTDVVRPEAAATVARLHARKIAVWIASGDRHANVLPLARELGVDRAFGDLRPAQKVELVNKIRAKGNQVAVVGDGVNDAPALAAAHVSFGLGDGTQVAASQADVALLRADLAAVVEAIDLARATDRVLRENLLWAFGYNVIAMPLAAGALYPLTHQLPSPMLASLAMAMSSLCVVANSLRLRWWKP